MEALTKLHLAVFLGFEGWLNIHTTVKGGSRWYEALKE